MSFIKIERAEEGAVVEKALASNKREVLSNHLRGAFKFNGCCAYTYLMDYDDEYVYFEVWVDSSDSYKMFKVSYSATETSATFGDDVVEVVRQTTYKEVDMEDEETDEDSVAEKVFKKLVSYITNSQAIGGTQTEEKNSLVVKQFDEAQMVAIEPLYCAPDIVDLQGDFMDLETITEMVNEINEKIAKQELQSKYFHTEDTQDFYFKKVWVNPVDCHIGEHFVPEGQPIAEVQFVSKEAWQARLEGDLMGLSIGGHAAEMEIIS